MLWLREKHKLGLTSDYKKIVVCFYFLTSFAQPANLRPPTTSSNKVGPGLMISLLNIKALATKVSRVSYIFTAVSVL